MVGIHQNQSFRMSQKLAGNVSTGTHINPLSLVAYKGTEGVHIVQVKKSCLVLMTLRPLIPKQLLKRTDGTPPLFQEIVQEKCLGDVPKATFLKPLSMQEQEAMLVPFAREEKCCPVLTT